MQSLLEVDPEFAEELRKKLSEPPSDSEVEEMVAQEKPTVRALPINPEAETTENHAETFRPPSIDPQAYNPTAPPPKDEEEFYKDIEAMAHDFMIKSAHCGHCGMTEDHDDSPLKEKLLHKGLTEDKIEKLKLKYPKTYRKVLDKVVHKDMNSARDKRQEKTDDYDRKNKDKFRRQIMEDELDELENYLEIKNYLSGKDENSVEDDDAAISKLLLDLGIDPEEENVFDDILKIRFSDDQVKKIKKHKKAEYIEALVKYLEQD